MDEKSIFQKIGDAVVDFAPGIAGILAATGVGAPVAAGVAAVAALGRSFGLGSNAKPEEVLSVISADPEIKLKAMIADNDFRAEMGRQEIEKLKTELADVQSARQMNIEGVKATGKRDIEDKVFDWMIVIGLFVIIGFMMYLKPPESTILGGLIGTVSTAFIAVVQFRKGTTASSQAKTDIIARSPAIK